MTRPRAGREGVGQSVISTSTTIPSRLVRVSKRFWRADILTNDAMRSCAACRRRLLQAKGDEDGLGHPLIERGYRVSRRMLVKRIMKDADHRGVAAGEDPGDAPAAPAVGSGRRKFHQDLVALHGAIHLVGRNKDVVVTASLAGFRPHKAKAVAMHIQTAGEQVVARGCLGKRPVIAVRLDQFAAGGHAVELFQQHAAFAPATQPQFANQLLVAGALAGGTLNTVEEFAVSHSRYIGADYEQVARKAMPLLILMGQPPRNSESFGMGDFNFAPSVIKMQRRARIARLARL